MFVRLRGLIARIKARQLLNDQRKLGGSWELMAHFWSRDLGRGCAKPECPRCGGSRNR